MPPRFFLEREPNTLPHRLISLDAGDTKGGDARGEKWTFQDDASKGKTRRRFSSACGIRPGSGPGSVGPELGDMEPDARRTLPSPPSSPLPPSPSSPPSPLLSPSSPSLSLSHHVSGLAEPKFLRACYPDRPPGVDRGPGSTDHLT